MEKVVNYTRAAIAAAAASASSTSTSHGSNATDHYNGGDNILSNLKSISANLTQAGDDAGCLLAGPVHLTSDHLNKLVKEKFNNATVIISVVILVLINFVVIAGNILVILAVLSSAKLRTVTNFFIVSLAVADFLVGIAVLPYSLTLEILDTWIFGETLCTGWLVIDVWMCTASILNLCAISVDRYLAVTQPVRYRSIMTAKRAKYIIAAVWIVSFIICFPLLVVRTKENASASMPWSGDTNHLRPSPSLSSSSSSSSAAYYSTNEATPNSYHNPKFKLLLNNLARDSPRNSIKNESIDYFPQYNSDSLNQANDNNIINDSAGDDDDEEEEEEDEDNRNQMNFAAPAIQAPYNLNLSQLTLSSPSPPPLASIPPPAPSPAPANESCTPLPVQCGLFRNKGYVIYSALGSFFIPMFVMIFFYWRIYLVAIRTTRALKRGYRTTKSSKDGTNEERLTLRIHRGYNTATVEEICSTTLGANKIGEQMSKTKEDKKSDARQQQQQQQRSAMDFKSRNPVTIYKSSKANKSNLSVSHLPMQSSLKNTLSPSGATSVELNGRNRRNSPGCQSTLSLPSTSSPSSSREGSAKSNKVALARLSKRTSKYQAKRFHAETKAAKTVGIIVGGFIVCWLPFFTVYLARAFCETCIPDLLFSIFFWLGYCNSMINPCIYGLFSRDFRRAFKNILCRCRLREETSVSSLIRQIHMPTFFEDMPEEMDKVELHDY